MRILVVSPFLPYPGVPHAGGKLVYFLLQTLSRNHSVHLVSRYFPGEEKHLGDLMGILSGLDLVFAPGPLEPGNLLSALRTVNSYYLLNRKAREVLRTETFDVCQVEFTETGVFWVPPRGVPAVLTCHDVIAKPAFRRYEAARGTSKVLLWLAWKAKRVMERRALSKFPWIFTLSEEDRNWAERLYPGVSFGVLRYPGGLGFTGLPRREAPGRVLFLGALNRPQNIESLWYLWKKVWPAVRERVPNAEFWVAGSGLPGGLERELSQDPRTVSTGFVENVEDIYREASVFVAPILAGGGVIVKILDALAAGVPVVTTPFGNEGIRAAEGEEILVANNPEDFCRFVIRLLEDPGFRTRIGEAGRRFALNKIPSSDFQRAVERNLGEIVLREGKHTER